MSDGTAEQRGRTFAATPATAETQSAIDDVLELLRALDDRVPQVDRAGERQIAIDSAGLKAQALERLASLRNRSD